MAVLEDVKERVDEIAAARGMKADRAFGFWFLEEVDDYSEEEAEDLVVDGPWDNGRDAVFTSDDGALVRIYQFKYSSAPKYVEKAFKDIQRAALFEKARLKKAESVEFHVVTTCKGDKRLKDVQQSTQRRIRKWMTDQGFDAETRVEFQDLHFFSQLFDELYGISVKLTFAKAPIVVDDAMLGLIDISALQKRVGEEELLAFNIRKFLGLHKGSVNSQIRQSLEEDNNRSAFWMLNNGIVCLCTEFEKQPNRGYKFDNFTIVNGAQTVNTVARFLNDNPAVVEPIWVVSKIIKVPQNDIDRARLLTKTSNTQSPTNNKDLRAVDIGHTRLKEWAKRYFDLTYVYRRGDRAPRGANAVTMKDIAQAHVAYVEGQPNVPFARVGAIFATGSYYDKVFPSETIDELRGTGDADDIREFMLERITPARLVAGTRAHIRGLIKAGEEKRWKSLAYHVVWVLAQLPAIQNAKPALVYERVDALVANVVPLAFNALRDFMMSAALAVPRDLKSTKAVDDLVAKGFLKLTTFEAANTAATKVLE